jgi:predicted DNA-binding WGR domain protein
MELLMLRYFQKIDRHRNVNKHYFLMMKEEGAEWVVYSAWGRIGNMPQTKRESFSGRLAARSKYRSLADKRTNNDYTEITDAKNCKVSMPAPAWWPAHQNPQRVGEMDVDRKREKLKRARAKAKAKQPAPKKPAPKPESPFEKRKRTASWNF